MGWDVLIFRLRDPATPLRELDETKVLPFGPKDEIRAAIDAVIPGVDWTEPEWGFLRIGDCTLEFNLKGDARLSLGIHVHGAGDPVSPIVALCRAHKWVAIDLTAGNYLDLDKPSEQGWRDFQTFRDRAIAAIRQKDPGEDNEGRPAK